MVSADRPLSTKYLVDSQIFVWHLTQLDRLPRALEALIESRQSYLALSLASVWELAIKAGSGRLPLPRPTTRFLLDQAAARDIEVLAIEPAHIAIAEALPFHHRDPFDRMIVAQAIAEGMTLITADVELEAYAVPVLLAAKV